MISCLHVFFRLQSVVCSFVPYTLYFNSGGSRPWAKGGSGRGAALLYLPCWRFSLVSFLLLFLSKIREKNPTQWLYILYIWLFMFLVVVVFQALMFQRLIKALSSK